MGSEAGLLPQVSEQLLEGCARLSGLPHPPYGLAGAVLLFLLLLFPKKSWSESQLDAPLAGPLTVHQHSSGPPGREGMEEVGDGGRWDCD